MRGAAERAGDMKKIHFASKIGLFLKKRTATWVVVFRRVIYLIPLFGKRLVQRW